MKNIKNIAKIIVIAFLSVLIIGLGVGLLKNCYPSDEPVIEEPSGDVAVEDIDIDQTNIVF